ncbi:MAG TPA: Hsp20/alpha crystallin family protein [archaeon]|nr:Hsp20/alpha crystallin family protein [archaeon]
MTGLVPRENFFQDLFDFRRDFDQIFNRILLDKPVWEERFLPLKGFEFTPAVECFIDKDAKKYTLRMSLPGIEPKEVEIHTKGNILMIKGERKLTHKEKELDFFHEEFMYGKFERTFELPEGVLPEKLIAEFHHGVLEITAPVTVAALPRKIEIKAVPLAKQVAA